LFVSIRVAWSLVSVIQQAEQAPEDACGADPSWICERVWDATGSEAWAQGVDVLVGRPAKIVLILAIAWLANRLVRRGVRRLTAQITDPGSQERIHRLKRRAKRVRGARMAVDTGPLSLRAAARAQTLGDVLRSLASILIWSIAAITILGELGVNLGPLIAGAGIAGVAIGFGAQSLVKDFLSGVFMLVEDQYGVGDIIDAGEASGTVEAVTLRTTRLRDVEGTVWHIPNGIIERVGNKSQQWARALLDINVAYGTDIDEAQQVIKQVADGLWRAPGWEGKILDEPEVWGIEQLGPDAIVIRLVVKTLPSEQFGVSRELRRRLSDAFYQADIDMPLAARSTWVRRDPGASREDPTDDQLDVAEPSPFHERPKPAKPPK
jgi:small-conductance mechanosensitive channel